MELKPFIREVNGALRQLSHDYQNNLVFRNRAVTISALWTFAGGLTVSAGNTVLSDHVQIGSTALATDGVFGMAGTISGTARDLISLGSTMDGAGSPLAIWSFPSFTVTGNNQVLGSISAGAGLIAKGAYTGATWYSYLAWNPSSVTGAGTIATAYGLWVDTITVGTANYSIYTGTAPSFFGGAITTTTAIATTRVTSPLLGTVTAADVVFDRNSVTQLTLGSLLATFAGAITHADTKLLKTTAGFTNGAAAAAGTLLNAPAAGNPTKWIPVDDNGTTRYIPAW